MEISNNYVYSTQFILTITNLPISSSMVDEVIERINHEDRMNQVERMSQNQEEHSSRNDEPSKGQTQ